MRVQNRPSHQPRKPDSTALARAVVRTLEHRATLGARVVISAELARWVAAVVRRVAGLEQAA